MTASMCVRRLSALSVVSAHQRIRALQDDMMMIRLFGGEKKITTILARIFQFSHMEGIQQALDHSMHYLAIGRLVAKRTCCERQLDGVAVIDNRHRNRSSTL